MSNNNFSKIGKAQDDISLIEHTITDGKLKTTLTKADGNTIVSDEVSLPAGGGGTQLYKYEGGYDIYSNWVCAIVASDTDPFMSDGSISFDFDSASKIISITFQSADSGGDYMCPQSVIYYQAMGAYETKYYGFDTSKASPTFGDITSKVAGAISYGKSNSNWTKTAL